MRLSPYLAKSGFSLVEVILTLEMIGSTRSTKTEELSGQESEFPAASVIEIKKVACPCVSFETIFLVAIHSCPNC